MCEIISSYGQLYVPEDDAEGMWMMIIAYRISMLISSGYEDVRRQDMRDSACLIDCLESNGYG